jgi:site-specific recombinase XerD
MTIPNQYQSISGIRKRKSPIPMAITPRELFDILKEFNQIQTMRRWELTGLGAFLYLSGARISEALMVKNKDITMTDAGFKVTLKTLKSRVWNIRDVPIQPWKSDKAFYEVLKSYMDDHKDPEEHLFSFRTRNHVNNLMKKIWTKPITQLDHINRRWLDLPYRMRPHYFRHCRASHLVNEFGFDDISLMKFFGWTSIKPCIFYIKMDYKQLQRKMLTPDLVTAYVRMMEGQGNE